MGEFFGVLGDNHDIFVRFFVGTVKLFAIAAVCSLVLGAILAAMRIAPVRAMRLAGATYVNLARNTPLTLVLVFMAFAVPKVGVPLSYFTAACIGLTLYTAAFVCESLRAGVNTIAAGQGEAARAIGLRFHQTLRFILLPQAIRASIPALVSVLIALLKNTTVATAVSVIQAGSLPAYLSERGENQFYANIWIALIFLALVIPLSLGQRAAERRAARLR